MIVPDASVILEVLLRTADSEWIEQRLFESAQSLHAPHLLDLEVAQVIRRYCRSGEFDPHRGSEMIADLADLPIERYPHQPFLQEIWSFRDHLTAYDAAYVVLAQVLGATLLTRDRRLVNAPVPGLRVEFLEREQP